MMNTALEYLLFLNQNGRYGYFSDFSESEIEALQRIKGVEFNGDLIHWHSFEDLKMINVFAEARLYRTLSKALRVLGYIPGVKQVAICNSCSLRTQTLKSDLDLFLILDHKSFFTTRLLMILALRLFFLKRSKRKYINRVCLSFIVSDKNLNLAKVRFKNDHYFKYWLDSLVFLGRDKALKSKFFNVNNAFEANLNYFRNLELPRLRFNSARPFASSKFLSLIERFNQYFQLKRAYRKYQDLNKPLGVHIRPGFLKFHNLDIRPKFNKAFQELLKKVSKQV